MHMYSAKVRGNSWIFKPCTILCLETHTVASPVGQVQLCLDRLKRHSRLFHHQLHVQSLVWLESYHEFVATSAPLLKYVPRCVLELHPDLCLAFVQCCIQQQRHRGREGGREGRAGWWGGGGGGREQGLVTKVKGRMHVMATLKHF